MPDSFQQQVIRTIREIPHGKVCTYGRIAAMNGNPRAARQVVRALHACSEREGLPWHRVVNAGGRISLPKGAGYEMQKAMLEDEGVEFGRNDTIDLSRFLWDGP